MNIGVYGLLIVFGAFVVLLIFNPNLSCFGKRIKSPFYPLLRRRARQKKKLKTEDFGFSLGNGDRAPRETEAPPPSPRPTTRRGKPLVTEDYGFNLGDSEKGLDRDESTAE